MSEKKRHCHSAQQIAEKLGEADRLLHAGQSVGQMLQALNVSQTTYHRWREHNGVGLPPGLDRDCIPSLTVGRYCGRSPARHRSR